MKINNKFNSKELGLEILSGNVLVLPFDTVYGLVANPFRGEAIQKIYDIKGRDFDKPIALIFSSVEMIKQYINVDPKVESFIREKTPGAHTFIFPWSSSEKKKFAKQYHSLDKVGIRIPNNKFILDLVEELSQPIAATSANISGEPNCWSIEEFVDQVKNNQLKPEIAVDGGELPKNPPSEVIDITDLSAVKILRN